MAKDERLIATLTLTGKDRSGVVARVTQALFEHGANIEALEEHVTRGTFNMSLTASWPPRAVPQEEEDRLRALFEEIGREVKMETRVRFHHAGRRQRMAILVTKERHCLEAILKRHAEGRLDAEPVLVVGNREWLKDETEAAGLPFIHIPFDEPKVAENELLRVLDEYEVDFLVLARFMKILSPQFCWRFRNKIINIHPSLLPSFPGASAYRQAWEKGVRVVGVTAHFVTPDLDQGPIIMQDAFNVKADDPLNVYIEKGQRLEAKVLLDAIDLYLKKRLDVHWGRVWSN